VEVVDPALEGDRELDEILAPAADQHPLGLPDAAHLHPREPGEHEAADGERAPGDGDRRRYVRRDLHPRTVRPRCTGGRLSRAARG
jgi:hypothetical protein